MCLSKCGTCAVSRAGRGTPCALAQKGQIAACGINWVFLCAMQKPQYTIQCMLLAWTASAT